MMNRLDRSRVERPVRYCVFSQDDRPKRMTSLTELTGAGGQKACKLGSEFKQTWGEGSARR